MGGSMCGCVGPGVLAVLLMNWNCGAMVAEVLAGGCQSVCVRGLIYKYAVNLSG